MSDLDKTRQFPASHPRGEEIIRPRNRGYARPLLIIGGTLAAVWVGVSGLGAVLGNGNPQDRAPQPIVREEPAKQMAPAPAEDPAYEAGQKAGEAYNEAKEAGKSFWDGFSNETTVDESLGELSEKANRELEKQLRQRGN